jgi:hypothetical protein
MNRQHKGSKLSRNITGEIKRQPLRVVLKKAMSRFLASRCSKTSGALERITGSNLEEKK